VPVFRGACAQIIQFKSRPINCSFCGKPRRDNIARALRRIVVVFSGETYDRGLMQLRRTLLVISIALFVFFWEAALIFAQGYTGSACSAGNPRLRNLISRGSAPGLSLEDVGTGGADGWTTSFLAAEGNAPSAPEGYDRDLSGDEYLHRWTCMYSAAQLRDGNPATAWSEGASDDGIGQIVVLPIDTGRPIRIWGGLGRSAALHAANNRPKKVKIYVISAGRVYHPQNGTVYSDLNVVLASTATLVDRNGFQTITLPAHARPAHSLLAIELVSVYRGTRFRDTLISEVAN
jgi:hypothetical protein